MDTNADSPVTALDRAQCFERLAEDSLGRLVTRVGGVVDVFPVNYALDGEAILFRTAEGSKLLELTVNDEVLFEVDAHSDVDAWSVVVRGHAEQRTAQADIEHADAVGLRPWIPTLKYNLVRITPREVTGRYFLRTQEPERYGAADY